MRIPLRPAGLIAGTAAVIATSFVMTNQGASSASPPTFSTTRANPADRFAATHAYDHSTLKAVVVTRNRHGKVVARNVYHGAKAKAAAKNAGKTSGTGNGPGGCFGNTKVTISKYGRSVLGSKLYTVSVHINWGFDCLAHDVNLLGQGRDWEANDGVWAWDGWVDGASNYFNWQINYPHSGYNRMGQGSFHGPCINTSTICHEYPTAHLRAHGDGSNWWETLG